MIMREGIGERERVSCSCTYREANYVMMCTWLREFKLGFILTYFPLSC